ncbi:COMM domain-containing protein 1 isoform X2 [Chiloscyllium plagiosum]|uniref:COMM domain-containing protein 1 isoform X2 n=1 Tax=Chiloscyllium plagiosum TaxID=36176 RepID=UPI001CB870A0|nr:COMM domain-containing protein 1 isoform X2 [Chiloscyllium plagiosum]
MAEQHSQSLSGLLSGLVQLIYYRNSGITEQMLKEQLYPDLPQQDFRILLEKMAGILRSIASADMDLNQLEAFLTAQTKKPNGITPEQATVLTKFWKSHKVKIRESLINQSKWENCLRNLSWRVDLKSQSRHLDQINTPVAIVEFELGKNNQESEFLCLELNEIKVNQLLNKLAEIEKSIGALSYIS